MPEITKSVRAMIVPPENLERTIRETIREFERTEEGRKALEHHRKRAEASDTDFITYLKFRALRFLAESQARAWLAEKHC